MTTVERRKTCQRCGQRKPLSKFHRDNQSRDGHVAWCKACREAYRREVYARDPQAAKDYQREWKRRNPHKVTEYGRRHRHGLEPEQYEAMLAAQGSLCAICRTNPGVLKVDHCHKTLAIRGLLCDLCNRGLGMFKDNPEWLRAAADYVEGGGAHDSRDPSRPAYAVA